MGTRLLQHLVTSDSRTAEIKAGVSSIGCPPPSDAHQVIPIRGTASCRNAGYIKCKRIHGFSIRSLAGNAAAAAKLSVWLHRHTALISRRSYKGVDFRVIKLEKIWEPRHAGNESLLSC